MGVTVEKCLLVDSVIKVFGVDEWVEIEWGVSRWVSLERVFFFWAGDRGTLPFKILYTISQISHSHWNNIWSPLSWVYRNNEELRITVKWVNRVSIAIHNNLFSSSWQPYWSKNESFVKTSSFLYCFPRATQMCGFFVVIAMCFHFKFNATIPTCKFAFLIGGLRGTGIQRAKWYDHLKYRRGGRRTENGTETG